MARDRCRGIGRLSFLIPGLGFTPSIHRYPRSGKAIVRQDSVDDLPSLDDVDPVVPGVHALVVGVGHDAHAQRASEEVADDLAEPRPSVAVAARRAVAFELAVFQQRFDGVPAAVPVQVDSDLPVGSGDDGSVSHDSPFRLAARPFGWPRGPGDGPVPRGVSGEERKPFRAHELSRGLLTNLTRGRFFAPLTRMGFGSTLGARGQRRAGLADEGPMDATACQFPDRMICGNADTAFEDKLAT